MSDSHALAHNTLVQLIGKALGMIFGVATVFVLLHYFGDFGYGEFTTAITYLSLFAVVVDFGLTLTTVQMISEPGADEPMILGNLFALRLVSGFLVFVLAPIIVLALPSPPEVKAAVAVGALGYFFATTTQMLVGIFQKHLQMWRVVLAELVSRMILFAGAVVVAVTHGSLTEIVIALVIGNVAQTALTIVLARPFVKIKSRLDFHVWKQIVKRSWPIGASIFFNLIYLRGDVMILSILRSQSEVGLYGAAYKLIDVTTALPVMFMGLVLPMMTLAWNGNRERFHQLLQQTFDLFAISALPITVGAFALATPIMTLVGGGKFVAAGPVLALLSPALAIVFFGALFGHAVVALNQQQRMVKAYAFAAIVCVIAYFLLIPPFGMYGAAWVTLLSESMVALMTFAVVQRTAKTKLKLTVAGKAVIGCAVMLLVLHFTMSWNVILQIIVGALIYVLILIALRAVDPRTVRSLLLKPKV